MVETYARGTDSQNARDFLDLRNWMSGGDLPYTVKYYTSMFNLEILRNTTGGGRYRAVICLLLRNHAKDFRTGQAISTSLILDENIEDHHVFPDRYLGNTVKDWSKRNCVLNRALVDELTNQTIGQKAPSKYLREIELKVRSDRLEEILKSQFLPIESSSGLFMDDYDQFLIERQRLIAKEIETVVMLP